MNPSRGSAMAMESQQPLRPEELRKLDAYWRAANYLSVGQIYLYANPLLREPLKIEHVKPRLLGHFGTTPGLNFVYAHFNRLIKKYDLNVINITGPGHGGPGIVANTYLEGSYTELYPDIQQNEEGMQKLFKQFSFPGGIPSHAAPETPGSINEGGELGYSVAHAYGAVFDNPDLLACCVVGDGEAETGALATSWHSNKFLNPARDGAVLPILHLNGFKIANPTVLARISRPELTELMRGYGYDPHFVEGDDPAVVHQCLAGTLDAILAQIRQIQSAARSRGETESLERPRWPMIIFRTPKGWTGPKFVDGKPVEGTWRAHQVPIADFKDPEHLKQLEDWMKSYGPQELFDERGKFREEFAALAPTGHRRMGSNPHANGGELLQPLSMPHFDDYAVAVTKPGGGEAESTRVLGRFLRDVMKLNLAKQNFRLFGPDETASNRLEAVYEVSGKEWMAEVEAVDIDLSTEGRVMEMLSEHMCEGWLEGYLLTGRHGLFSCYEAFIHIIDSMFNQHAKWLKVSKGIPWRKPIASLNYLLTSEAWRQDHNGFSHQGPGFINNLLTKKGHTYRIYLPPDANCLLSTMEHCLRSTNYINLVIAGKQPMHQWLSMEEAIDHCRVGASVWRWASTNEGEDPEIVPAACGDNLTLETLAAAQILREEAPSWRVRVVNVTDLLTLGIPQKSPHGLEEDRFQRIFPLDCPVIFEFHGYTAAIKQLCWERPNNERFDINGFREEGSTTTPFDMHVRNKTSRYHVVVQAARKIAGRNLSVASFAEDLVRKYEAKIAGHRAYVTEKGVDPPEIADWQWRGP